MADVRTSTPTPGIVGAPRPAARRLAERFSPINGVPLRVGSVWPPRPMIHDVCGRGEGVGASVVVTFWMRHLLQDGLRVRVLADPVATGADNVERVGSRVEPLAFELGAGRQRGVWIREALRVGWDQAFAGALEGTAWVRQGLVLELSQDDTVRRFQWYLYFTPHAAEVPHRSSQYDDHPHFRWVDTREGPLSQEGIARNWIELPAAMSTPSLPPACWVQEEAESADHGPDSVELVPVFPMEPAIGAGREAAGWNGALGGHDPRPRVQALAVHGSRIGGAWGAQLRAWDCTMMGGASVRQKRTTVLEEPTDCVWPEVISSDPRPLVLYDLVGRNTGGCEVKVNLRIRLPDSAEAVRVERADIRLGPQVVGRWDGPPLELTAGQEHSLPCVIDLHLLREASDGRLRLTLVFVGRPTRGVVRGQQSFRTENGPFARLMRSRASQGRVRTPWLCIDLGTEGACAAVAFLDGYVPRVINATFDDGPVFPTRVHLAPGLDGTWELTDEPQEDGLYTSLVKMGLRFGEGAHPGCPDHISATEVARFFLKRFLLEVRERMAWFPLEDADVLVSFPPRLAAMPRFVAALRDTFDSVLGEVVWTRGNKHRLRFREEAFLVAVPTLYRELEVSPMAPGTSRYYWVMDFGGGTTDVCGFLCTADEFGEEHVVSRLTYPQRLAHHLSGNDVTAAFYQLLRWHLNRAGVIAGAEEGDDDAEERMFPLPSTPFPSARSTPAALQNQNVIRELADALKCVPTAQQQITVRAVARGLKNTVIRTVDGVRTTVVALLAGEALELGARSVASVHREVLDPQVGRSAAARDSDFTPRPQSDSTIVKCSKCREAHALPRWAFASHRAFRFRCRACGHAQRVQLEESVLPDTGDEGAPTLLEYRNARVQTLPPAPARGESASRSATPLSRPRELAARPPRSDVGPAVPPLGEEGELYLEQDGRTYVVRDLETLRRWVVERRVARDDLFSIGGISWQALELRPELEDLFRQAGVIAVDTTQEVTRPALDADASTTDHSGGRTSLGRDLRLFLAACREALDHALDALPDGRATEVVVLIAGRASRFEPISRGIHDLMPGRVLHLTNAWVRRSYGSAGQIDPSSDLKTMTVNGGGLFALLQSNVETSHLVLSFDTHVMDCATYLQAAASTQPWLLTHTLDLRPGRVTPIARDRGAAPDFVEDLGTTTGEPPSRALPQDTALTGELHLVVEGLPEDRSWEPWVTIAKGTARRYQGRRARTGEDTALRTELNRFVLQGLAGGREIEFLRMLPRLNLLGGSSVEDRRTPEPPPVAAMTPGPEPVPDEDPRAITDEPEG